LAICLVAVSLDPTRVLLGLLRHESFFQGRPTSYWARRLDCKVQELKANPRWALKKAIPIKDFLIGESYINYEMDRDSTLPVVTAVFLDEMPRRDADPAALPVLRELLKDDRPEVRWAAIVILGNLRSEPSTASALLKWSLRDKDPWVRQSAAWAIADLGSGGKECVPDLIESMKNKETKRAAVWALGKIGPQAQRAIPALVAALNDEDRQVCLHAAWALAFIGKEAVRHVIGAMENADLATRVLVICILGQIGPDAQDALPVLNARLLDESNVIQEAAAKALRRIKGI
jgi:hypothetical protein